MLIILLAYLESQGSTPPPSISYAASIIGAIAAGAAVILTALTQLRLARVDKKVDAVHTLSNSAMGSQLLSSIEDKQALSVVLHANAAKSGLPDDLAAATAMDVRVEAAKKLYQEHQKNQAVVDANIARGK